mmetsp:Transcript_34690/g.62986  ORF Transcript_34690/g.62986 Transcript_34690/m.62986 type:complete len:395 (-) Transcript_34690:119-1303(-)|eukprot:CAMPEP_0197631140 /NCGR_PEP_ID=MMETSP1338-20131121/8409_1 /TAXON_ID=43686 ORGANISM="Pelagodinium beii, Strain RCC1491" /NCGR_SAMPLE_ID=MMETSP1338 /ASSEMBLY_ACC=CAM_ASM_000754 /LENGTH=394 /DNA_ID=CAMNT_0043202537 /DNA_START=1 /DNA_END=1185 /DNA_ORIENTATION=-
MVGKAYVLLAIWSRSQLVQGRGVGANVQVGGRAEENATRFVVISIVGFIFLALCGGLLHFLWRSREDLHLLLPWEVKPKELEPAPVPKAKAKPKRKSLRKAGEVEADEEAPPEQPQTEGAMLSRNNSKASTADSGEASDAWSEDGRSNSKGSKISKESGTGSKKRRNSRGPLAAAGHGFNGGGFGGNALILEPGDPRGRPPLPKRGRSNSVRKNSRVEAGDSSVEPSRSATPEPAERDQVMARAGGRGRVSRGRGQNDVVARSSARSNSISSSHSGSSRGSRPPSAKGAPRDPPSSGAWNGKLSEAGRERSGSYSLHFHADHKISGAVEGNDGLTYITGSFNPDNQKIQWVEKHPWGSVKVSAQVSRSNSTPRIHGQFEASDGGKGKLDLCPGS